MTSPEPNNNRSPKADGNEPMLTTLTLRIIMQGKEAGSIIGKKGDNVKRFREESGARINISDASCPERIVTVTGTTEQIVSAFSMICRRFEEDLQNANPNTANSKQLITLRLIIPATQCGSLIGKGGTKIKEIRDIAGASIQISSDMLPNSTERAVTVSGSVEAVTRGIFNICAVMLESPPKGATIPYRPKLVMAPVIMAGGQAFTVPGQFVVPQADPRASQQTAVVQYQPVPQFAKMAIQQGTVGHAIPQYMAAQYMAALAPSYQALGISGFVRAVAPPPMVQTTQTHEISIPNDLIGCIIGRGGSKINEIRQLSGANIKIAGAEEGSMDRTVTITGLPEAISAAQYLINTSLQLHNTLALNLDPGANTFSPGAPLTALPPSSVALTPINVGAQAIATEYHSAVALTSMKTMALPPMALTPVNSPHASSAMNAPVNAAPVAMPPVTVPMVNLPPLLNSAMFGPMPLAPQQSTPSAPFAIPMGSLVKPFPVLNYGSVVGTTFFDTRADLATKIKGGMALAAGRNGNKFTPY